jgi:hypothetical protein
MRKILFCCVYWSFGFVAVGQQPQIWTTQKANAWYAHQPWLVGCNFIPSTAINELEMWQSETFDTATINRELGWAHQTGFNLVRVFLHFIPWQSDREGFKQRINTYLKIARLNQIGTMFVLFDDCWNDDPHPGKQPQPKPGVHNSGWMQCPGKKMHNDSSTWGSLEAYVKDILSTFKKDDRILIWDLYNEPGNSNYNETTLPLLEKVFQWAWEVRPSQPLTCGVWFDKKVFNDFQLGHSDIISFHNYNKVDDLEKQIQMLKQFDRPLICSEYMARPRGSTFQTHLPVFKRYRVAAVNWGLVEGKTNTIYEWDKPVPDGSEPAVWFHDIFRPDGRAYDPKEVAFIKNITASR